MSSVRSYRATRFAAAFLFLLTITRASTGADPTELYYSGGIASVNRASIDGAEPRPLVRDIFTFYNSMAADADAGKLYWNDANFRQILRSNVDGSDVEVFVCDGLARQAVGLCVDPVEGKLYWFESGFGHLKRASLDGTDVELVSVFPGLNVYTMAIDEVGRALFWISEGSAPLRGPTVQRFDLVDRSLTDVVDVLSGGPVGASFGLAIDPVDRKIYWRYGSTLTSSLGPVFWANLDGSNREPVVMEAPLTATDPTITVDPVARRLYWQRGSQLFGGNLDGSDPTFITEPFYGEGFTVDRSTGRLYANTHGAGIRTVDPEDPAQVDLIVLPPPAALEIVVVDANRQMYWTEGLGIYRAATTGAGRVELIAAELEDPFTADDPYAFVIWSMDVDVNTGWLYWIAQDTIWRADLDGQNAEVVVADAPSRRRRLRLDAAAQKLYWSDSNTGNIRRTNVDGTANETFIVGTKLEPARVQHVDPIGGWLYYSIEDRVLRAGVDGTPPVELFSVAVGVVHHLCVDADDRVYWTGSGGIRRANLDGSDVEEVGMLSAGTVTVGRAVVRGDVDGDGRVDLVDLNALLIAWGDCPCRDACIGTSCPTSSCAADFDLSERVGMNDLTILLNQWGATR